LASFRKKTNLAQLAPCGARNGELLEYHWKGAAVPILVA
jgi:hypothetical protein